MCDFMVSPILTAMGASGATAAAGGTAATAATTGATLANVGTALSIGGTLFQTAQTFQAARENEALIANQRATERQITATRDQRERREMRGLLAQQTAELVARGVQLDSPTAIFLGQSAAKETAFQSEATRSGGAARDAELSAEQRTMRARGRLSLLRGGFSAAGQYLTSRADQWGELAA